MDSKKTFFNEIRIICCAIVIYEHCIVLANIDYVNAGLRGTCVNVFFILSGYWVTKSYIKSETIKEYALKRFKRIFPMYSGVVIFCAFFFCIFSSFSIKEYLMSRELIKYLVANLTGMNFLCHTLPGVFNGAVINGSLWTIKIEVGFYIILPLIVYIFKRIKEFKRKYWITLIYLLSVLYAIFMPFIVDKYSLPDGIVNQLPMYLAYFVAGMTFELFPKVYNCFTNLKRIFLSAFALVIFNHVVNSVIATITEPIVLAIMIFWIAYNVKPALTKKEELSYGMYLVHFPIIQLYKWLGYFDRYPFVAIIAVFATSYMITAFFNFCVECRKNMQTEMRVRC